MSNHTTSDESTPVATDKPDHGVSQSQASVVDAAQNRQIQQLRRNMFFAWIAAISGPLLALLGVTFTALQWRAADHQLEIMRSQLRDAREGAEQAREDTARALRIAERQAGSLNALAQAGITSADVADRQRMVMEFQARLMQAQLRDARTVAAETNATVTNQLKVAEAQAVSLQRLTQATQDAAAAATVSAAHARATVEVLQTTLHVQERAWIRFDQLRRTFLHVPWLMPHKVRLRFQNSGRTPARNVRVALVWEVADSPGDYSDFLNHGYYAVLGPGEKIDVTPAVVPHPIRDRIRRRTRFIHGYITYEDIFAEQHRLDLCFVSHSEVSGWQPCRKDAASITGD